MRLLVVRLSALGDVVHTIPAAVALRERFDVAWAVEAPYAELVEIVAGVRAIPVSLKRWSGRRIAEARRGVRGFDVAVDFQGLIKSALLARASGARERVGFAREFIREKPAAFLMNRRVRIDPSRHVVEWNMQLARALAPEAELPRVDFGPFAAGSFDAGGSIVVLPGAGRPSKQWPHFRELVAALGARCVAAWGPGERELAEATGAEPAPPTTLRELAQLLRSARLVVGGDTGPLHLAAALGTPVVGLYGPTSPARNGPFGQLSNVVSTFSTSRSMGDIRASGVLAKIDEVLR
jgi:heptosyltransferase-1